MTSKLLNRGYVMCTEPGSVSGAVLEDTMKYMGTLDRFDKMNFINRHSYHYLDTIDDEYVYHRPTMPIDRDFPGWAVEFPCIMDIDTREQFFGENECLRFLGILEEKALNALIQFREL